MANTRRVTIDLTDAASSEIDRIREETGMTIADIFRHSFTFLRMYMDAKKDGKEMRIIDPKKPRDQVQIEFPTVTPASPASGKRTKALS